MLAFVLLVGLRAAFAIPATLQANWVFRISESNHVPALLSGVKRSLAVCAVVPLFALLAPLHAWLWGPSVGALHFVSGVLASLFLVELLLFGDVNVPFTTPYVPGKGHLNTRWPLYVLGLVVFTQGFAAVESAALTDGATYAAFAAGVACSTTVLATVSRRVLRNQKVVFDEQPEPAVQTLGLD